MKRTKVFVLSAMAGAIALATAACGSDASTPAAVADTSTSAAPPSPTSSTSSPSASSTTASSTPAATRFEAITAPVTDTEKRAVRATGKVSIGGTSTEGIGYEVLLRSGDTRGADLKLNTFGQIVDNTLSPILTNNASAPIADSNDFTSILKVGAKLFSVAQFESLPGAMYLTELAQDTAGRLSALSTRALDLSSINGIWNPCAGMVTPWNTHLGSEEYEPDARKGQATAASMAPFFGGSATLGGDPAKPNPYFYGFPVEVAVTDEAGTTKLAKHYSMGRMAHEVSYVMPDQRTVYQTDDGTNVGLFMYVADKAGDLSAGALYAMKWTQTSPAGASDMPDADISWIRLGSASDAELKSLIDSGITFADIFDTATPNADGACPAGFTSVNANGVGEECLSLKTGKEKAAAFLETRRYAGYLGATTELRKEEGITFDPDGKRLYVAYSEVQYGMEDYRKNNAASKSYDLGTSNDVKALFNACGAVYGYDVGTDATIGSDFVARKASGVIAGRMTTLADPSKANPSTIDRYADGTPYAGSSCAIDGIANPDNLSFMPGQNTLLIGEDTGTGHQNDAAWAYNVESKTLTRILTTPYGAETTSLYYYPDVNDHGYIVTVVQHPYGESDTTLVSPDSSERRSYLGVIGPLPPKK